jgi:hypothetical protein
MGKVIPDCKKNRGMSIIHDEDMVKQLFQMSGTEWRRKTSHQFNFCIPESATKFSLPACPGRPNDQP